MLWMCSFCGIYMLINKAISKGDSEVLCIMMVQWKVHRCPKWVPRQQTLTGIDFSMFAKNKQQNYTPCISGNMQGTVHRLKCFCILHSCDSLPKNSSNSLLKGACYNYLAGMFILKKAHWPTPSWESLL